MLFRGCGVARITTWNTHWYAAVPHYHLPRPAPLLAGQEHSRAPKVRDIGEPGG